MSNQNSESVEKAMGAPQLCQKGCGFFQNGGGLYCSKCAKEVSQQEEKQRATEIATSNSANSLAASLKASQAAAAAPALATASLIAAVAAAAPPTVTLDSAPSAIPAASIALAEALSSATASSSPAAPPPNPNRCFQCRKKVGLTGFKCKCEHVFCGSHRLAECHECPYDYKTVQRAQLAEANPVIQAAKVQKI
eukprot:gene16990-23263_t